jgi:capsular polysaccharide biosynthesis protein
LNFKTFLATVRTYWKTFVIVGVAVVALGLTGIYLWPLKYVSTTQLVVSIEGSTTATAYENDDVVAGRVNSYIALLTSDVVSQRVIDKLGLSMSAPELAAKISATNVPPKTSVIDVAVTDSSPDQARRLADTVANEFVSYTDALETPTGEDGQKVKTTVVSAASEPHARLAERIVLAGLVVVGALVLGGLAVWIRSVLDPVVRTPTRAAALAGIPVLGKVTSALAVSLQDLEGYRCLRTRLRGATSSRDARAVEMTAVSDGTDAFRVAMNLGRAMQLAGSRTIVLDVNPQASQPGEVNGDRNRARRGTRLAGFPDTLPASAWAISPDRVATKVAHDLIAQLGADYEYVFIAAPPTLSTFTASALSEYADAVLLLAVLGTTKRRDLIRAAETFNATDAPLVGLVLVSGADDSHEPQTASLSPEPSRQQSVRPQTTPTRATGKTFEGRKPLSSLRQREGS